MSVLSVPPARLATHLAALGAGSITLAQVP